MAMSTNNWKMKLAGVPDGLLFATLRPGARAFTPVRSLNGQPSEGFSLAADGHGNVVAAWLAVIIINLLLIPGYFDVALRDFGLFLAALALARLSQQFSRG